MTPAELLRKEAAKDRHAAQILLEPEPSRSVFFCQQAAEKAAKAFLTFHQIAFRKTHDLKDLGLQCVTADPSLGPILQDVEELTDYASAFRYPDAPYEPDTAEAAGALAVAAKLCDEIRRRIEGAQEP
jgi:HEPN domain-containing protein